MFSKFCTIFLAINLIQCESVFEQEVNPSFCNFFDTINITGGLQNPDESITFDDVRFAKQDYGIFTYTFSANGDKLSVPAHTRGCVCKYKNCVRMCCPLGYIFKQIQISEQSQHECVPNNSRMAEFDLKHLLNIEFVSGVPCEMGYKWIPPNKIFDKWEIIPNGSLVLQRYLEPFTVNRSHYCLARNEVSTDVILCESPPDEERSLNSDQIISSAAMIISIVFLSLTLFVYFWIEELRTLHGKTFMCYLATWIIGYSVMSFGRLSNWQAYERPVACLILAEAKQTAFTAGFIWLSIIGFDIWRAVGRAEPKEHQFIKNCMYTFVTTFLIVFITNILDHVNLLEPRLRPGLGTSGCWLQRKGPAFMLYLYSTVIIVVVLNTVFFLLTKRKIQIARNRSNCLTSTADSKKFSHEETDADRFKLFCRLAVVMGLPWLLQIAAWPLYVFTYYGIAVFQIINLAIKLMGPVVFYLSINKRRVKRLIGKRWSKFRSTSFGSSTTQST